MFWGLVTGRLLWALCGFTFPWLFIFLEVLHCCFHVYSSSHLFQSLLTDFGREILPSNPAGDSEALLDLLWICLLHVSWFLLWGNSWAHIPFSVLQYSRLGAARLSFAFPKMEVNIKFVISPWLTGSGWRSACVH